MFRLPDSWVWDFWIAEDEGIYHLFFLYASRALLDPDLRHHRAAVGHATSRDLVSWERVADALVHGERGSFDETAIWTGSVVKGQGGRWHLFYTGMRRRDDGTLIQRIGVATSDDLHRWVKVGANPVAVADGRWYETSGGEPPWRDEHWRDPWVFADPDGNGWHMLITARAAAGPVADRGVIGHAWSADLRDWEIRQPLSAPGSGFGQLEVLQVENVDGRHVLIFNCLAGELVPGRAPVGHPRRDLGGECELSARPVRAHRRRPVDRRQPVCREAGAEPDRGLGVVGLREHRPGRCVRRRDHRPAAGAVEGRRAVAGLIPRARNPC